MNLAENLESSAIYFPDRPAIIEGKREVSYLELDQESNCLATALMKLGVQRGDPVALCAPSSYQWLACYFGVLKAGAVAVTLPSALTTNEPYQLFDDSRPQILFTVGEKLD